MPAGDRTGPFGEGPRTGRGLGYCSGSGAPGYAAGGGWGRGFGPGWGRGFGRGRGRGFGRGWGFRNAYYPARPLTREEEAEELKREASYLKTEMDAVNRRLKEMESE